MIDYFRPVRPCHWLVALFDLPAEHTATVRSYLLDSAVLSHIKTEDHSAPRPFRERNIVRPNKHKQALHPTPVTPTNSTVKTIFRLFRSPGLAGEWILHLSAGKGCPKHQTTHQHLAIFASNARVLASCVASIWHCEGLFLFGYSIRIIMFQLLIPEGGEAHWLY